MTLTDSAAFARLISDLHWMDRPAEVTIGPALRAKLGGGRAALVRLLVPVCGCLPGGLSFVAVIATGLMVNGLGWPHSWVGPASLFGAAVGAAFLAKLVTLLGSWAVLQTMARGMAAPRVLTGEDA